MPWLVAMLLMTMPTQLPTAEFPQARIASPQIEATIYLPDRRAGYYRGTRFDWSGAIASLRWRGREFFGPWFDVHDPLVHDAITGPVEEFQAGDTSVGYVEAAPGGTFVRIGVGHVRKPAEPAYRRFATYDIVDHGTWTVERSSDAVTFEHTLPERAGYGYVYRKTLRLDGNRLLIAHVLRNTGRKRIDTAVYNHNFFTIDRRGIGPSVSVRFPFTPRPLGDLGPLARLDGQILRFTRDLKSGEHVFTELAGFERDAAAYDFRFEQAAAGVGVRLTADKPLTKLVFWSASTTACPEPYIDASVDPGQEARWDLTYEFYELGRPAP